MGLKYTGGGFGGSLPNLPARDLSAAEIEALESRARQAGFESASAMLVASGLYEVIPAAEAEPPAEEH